jgi:phosphate-selective porin OprO/OprP
MTSSKFTSFMERASFTDAFNYNRRSASALIANDKKTDSWLFQAGIFNQPINERQLQPHRLGSVVRGVYSPTLGTTRLHLGASFQHRVNNQDAQNERLPAAAADPDHRPALHRHGNASPPRATTSSARARAIHKSLHFAAEAQKVWVNASTPADPGSVFDPEQRHRRRALLNGNPSFWGGYAEVGYYLTGETRGYKGGKFDRTKVLHPFNDGGWGAFQVNGRVDYVELRDRVDGSSLASPRRSTSTAASRSATRRA